MKAFSLCIDKKQQIFFEKPNNQKPQNKKLNKMSFSSSANSQYFLTKISTLKTLTEEIQ